MKYDRKRKEVREKERREDGAKTNKMNNGCDLEVGELIG
jgi:hypothetical protein